MNFDIDKIKKYFVGSPMRTALISGVFCVFLGSLAYAQTGDLKSEISPNFFQSLQAGYLTGVYGDNNKIYWGIGIIVLEILLIVIWNISLRRSVEKRVRELKEAKEGVEATVLERTKELHIKTNELKEGGKFILDLLNDASVEKEILRLEKEKLVTILKSIGDAVFVVDKNLNLILVNEVALKLAGDTIQDYKGKPYKDIFKFVYEETDEANELFVKNAVLGMSSGEKGKYTCIVNKNDGTKTPISESATPLINNSGEILGAVIVFRDISKELEIDQEKTEFVSLASHQLKTPVGGIKWNLEMLLNEDYGPVSESQREVIADALEMGTRMSSLINGFLNISRIELGVFSVDPEPVDFVKVCEDVLKELEPQIFVKQHQILKKYDAGLSETNADPKLLHIIFQNLISNAIKYTPEKGRISIAIEKKINTITISVANNGEPIPEKDKGKIFSKLFRASNAGDQDPNGNGLGLYLIKKILVNSGGSIWFDTGEGKDTVFYVTFSLSGMTKRAGAKMLV